MYVWLIMLVLFMKLEWFTKLFSTIAGLPNRFPHRKSLLCIGNLWHTVIINTTCLPCPPRDTYLQQAENAGYVAMMHPLMQKGRQFVCFVLYLIQLSTIRTIRQAG